MENNNETLSLTIRSLEDTDLNDVFYYLSDDLVMGKEKAKNLAETSLYLAASKNNQNHLALELKDSKKVIGELTYFEVILNEFKVKLLLNKDYFYKGYEKEALKYITNILLLKGAKKLSFYVNFTPFEAIELIDENNKKNLKSVDNALFLIKKQ